MIAGIDGFIKVYRNSDRNSAEVSTIVLLLSSFGYVFKLIDLHGTGSVWDRYKIGPDKPCVYTGPGGFGTDRICYLVPNGSTYEGDPLWNSTVPVQNLYRVNRVDPIPNGSEHIRSRVNVALISFISRKCISCRMLTKFQQGRRGQE